MKSYNGIYASSNIPDHLISVKSPTNNLSITRSRGSLHAEDPFTVQDLRHEYNRALNYIDKLKFEQNNLKDSLKMTLDYKRAASPAENSNSFQRASTPQNKPKGIRDSEKQANGFEYENKDLKSQLDTALIRIAKLQREKHVLQEKMEVSESPTNANKELVNEIRSLTHEIKVLTTRMQELEEENKALLQHKKQSNIKKSSQNRDQSLPTYFNYISKLISSISKSSFARNCFEERFASLNVIELIEHSQFEPVLLKAFKYITDLLININSIFTEEDNPKPIKSITYSNHVYSENHPSHGSRHQIPREVDEDSPIKRKPYQESHGDISPSSTEVTPMIKHGRSREEYTVHKNSRRPSESEQYKHALHKIVAPFEEPQIHKKSTKHHSRNYSSIIGSGTRVHDSYIVEDERMMNNVRKEPPHGDSKQQGPSYLEVSDDYSPHSKRRGSLDDSGRFGGDAIQKCSSIVIKAKKDGKYMREYDDVDNEHSKVYNEPKSRESRPRLEKDDSQKSIRKGNQRPRAIVIESKYGNEFEQTADDNSKRPNSSYSRQGKFSYPDLSSVQRKDDRSRSTSGEREIMYELEERSGGIKKGHHRQDSHDFKKQKSEPYVNVVEQARSRSSIQEVQHTIHETQESKENEERQVSEKRTKHRKKEQHDEEEEEEEDNREQQEMWEKKREELARMTRKTGSVQSNASELKGKEYPTFRVSFGRTESKNLLSPSPERHMVNTIIDVPRKKRVDHKITKFDVITGGDTKICGYYSPKVNCDKPMTKFYFEEGRKKDIDKSSIIKRRESQKSLSLADKTVNESELEASNERE